MKILIKVSLTLLIALLMISNLNAIPDWIPEEKQASYYILLDSLKEYSKILKSEHKIIHCNIEDEKIEIIAQRHTLKFKIVIGDFYKATECEINKNKIILKYVKLEESIFTRKNLIVFLTGVGAGGFLTIFFICFLL